MRPLYNRWAVLGWEFYQEGIFWLLDNCEGQVLYCPCKMGNSVTKRRNESLATLLVFMSGHNYSVKYKYSVKCSIKTCLSEVRALQERCQQILRQEQLCSQGTIYTSYSIPHPNTKVNIILNLRNTYGYSEASPK